MDCICSDIANLSAHLHRLLTPPPYLRRMRLSPGRVRRCLVQDEAVASQGAGVGWQMMLLVVRGRVPANHRAHFKKCKLLITKQLTFGAVLGEHKLSSPSTRLKVNHLCIRCLYFESVRGDLQEGHSYASRCHLSFCSSTKTTILCSGGLVCALSAGQQPAGSRKHPAGNQKKTACNQKQTRPEPKHPPRWPPETNRLVSKKSAGAPRWSAGRPLCK